MTIHDRPSTFSRRRRPRIDLRAIRGLVLVAALGWGSGLVTSAEAHTRITTDLTWSEDVRSILRQHCMRCHRPGGVAPSYADFTTYGTDSKPGARAWATAIEEEVLTGRMPPWQADPRYGDFSNARRLSKEETDILVGWVQGGAPQGPRRDLPPPPEFVQYAWELGEPDLIVEPPVAFELQGGEMTGRTEHTIDLQLSEDTWLTGFEFQPDSASAVHRITAWLVPPRDVPAEELEVEVQVPYDPFRPEDEEEPTRMRAMPQTPQLLGQWARGSAPVLLPAGAGKRLRAGTEVRLQVEYQRRALEGNDQILRDRSRLGLHFAITEDEVDLILEARSLLTVAKDDSEKDDTKKKRRKKRRRAQRTTDAEPAVHRAALTLDEDVRLVALHPTNVAGAQDLEVRAVYPDQRSVTLLLISEFDADWPASFWLRDPLEAPAGTRIEAISRGASEAPTVHVDTTLTDHLVLPEVFEITNRPTTSPSGGMVLAVVSGGLDDLSDADTRATGEGEGSNATSAAPSPSAADPPAVDLALDPNAAAHMDHSPLHGGQFFMAANQYHHLEGALPEEGRFRLYFYDDFKQPVDPRNFAGTVVFERYDEQTGDFTEETYPMGWISGSNYLSADIPNEMPAEFFASVWLAGEQARFDFYFEELSKRIIEAPSTGPRVVGAAHSHERPPLTIPGTAPQIVTELVRRVQQIRDKMAAGDWLKLYVPAFDGRDLAEALLDELAGISARETGAVRKAVSRILQSAAALDRAGDLADPARAQQALQRFAEAVEEIRRVFPQ